LCRNAMDQDAFTFLFPNLGSVRSVRRSSEED
jgi:hypothetical protein